MRMQVKGVQGTYERERRKRTLVESGKAKVERHNRKRDKEKEVSETKR